ncbi:MAG: DUF2007 domain-containing protein [Bacteroidales bacterium]|jgi:hypothetical protein|nr:DUF2007 domain-containing protein [Bacteroidales bacterium]
MKTEEEIRPIEIFTGTVWQAVMLKNLLEDAGIKVYLRNEINGTIFPFLTSFDGAGVVRVVVASSDYETANKIANEYKENLEK